MNHPETVKIFFNIGIKNGLNSKRTGIKVL